MIIEVAQSVTGATMSATPATGGGHGLGQHPFINNLLNYIIGNNLQYILCSQFLKVLVGKNSL